MASAEPPLPLRARTASDDVPPTEPHPATRAALGAALTASAAGWEYSPALERLLLELEPGAADALMMLYKEGRGAWAGLLEGEPGRTLFLGNALSGTIAALTVLGHDVVVGDHDHDRVRFSRVRAEGNGHDRTGFTCTEPDRLPFRDASFDLVVVEEGASASMAEVARVARDELVWIGDNRLAYKRSTGRRGEFEKPGPVRWLGLALRPAAGERSLHGYRRLVSGAFGRARAFALYPAAREFSHVVNLDGPRPSLTVGPQERRNRLKLLAHGAGLFPLLTPSFCVIGRRSPERGTTRLQRVLSEIAERLDQPTPVVDQLVATRSDNALVLTAPEGAGRVEPDERPGWWALHVPLAVIKRGHMESHARRIETVRERFPALPLPEVLFMGEADGVWNVCSRRLPGSNATQLTGNHAATDRLFREASRHFAALVLEPEAVLDDERFDRLVSDRFWLVRAKCAVDSTVRRIDRMLARAREGLVGRPLPLLAYHSDLRPRHVQVRDDGGVLAYLDWGASEERFLPYVDILTLIAHQRHQEERWHPARGWDLVRERTDLRDAEREALDGYADTLGLEADLCQLIADLYPLFIAGVAERNWDYSRPRWLHRLFDL